MIKAGENAAVSSPQQLHVRMERDGIEGVRCASAPQAFGVEAAAGQMIAVHRYDNCAGNPGRKRECEGRFATPGNAPDADQIDFWTLPERCKNGIDERCGVIHDEPRMLHDGGPCR